MEARNVDLVIVGASFAGLVCARTAAQRGLKTVVIEAKPEPGARIHTTGILVKEAAEEVDTPPQFSRAIHGVRLYAPSLKFIDLATPDYYFLTTDTAGLIRWLADEARHAGAEILCGRKCEVAERTETGLLLPQFGLHTRYLIGADGSRSMVRDAIGAAMQGEYGIGHHYNVIFRAPEIARAHRHGDAIMYWQVNDQTPSLLGPMDVGDRWFFMPPRPPGGAKFSIDDMPALIRRSTGLDTPIEVLSSDEWVASRLVADRYQDRRVFLAGDACHLHPPFGGYGMNMGVVDGVDLGWKIAATLQGWGGPALLETYTIERKAVHERVIEEAVANHAVLSDRLAQPGIEDATPAGDGIRREVAARIQATKIREFYTLGITLGLGYDRSPILAEEPGPPPARDFLNYRPTARPGYLAPHAWLHDGSSLYDHFGWGFALVVTSDGTDREIGAMRDAAAALNVSFAVVRPELGVLGELYAARYALIRPDQHVAWRGDRIEDAQAILARATGR